MPLKELEPDKELLEYLRSGKERRGLGERFEVEKKYIDEEEVKFYLEAFKEWYKEYGKENLLVKDLKDLYNSIQQYLPSLPSELNQKEIQKIVEGIEAIGKSDYYLYSRSCKGVFISYLVNHDEIYPEKRIELEINEPFDYLGLFNQGKEWVIKGNVGDGVGKYMDGGEIIVKSDVGGWVGSHMENGRIVIEGNAGEEIGRNMKGGKIIVKGDARSYVGCFMQGGKIIVKGDVGWYVGNGMKRGKIVIEGNAGDWVGEFMGGGEIWIKGDVGDFVGSHMENGRIVIEGDAGNDVSHWMKGGEIRIKGNCKSLSNKIHGGNIYNWDDKINDWKLIVENRRRLV